MRGDRCGMCSIRRNPRSRRAAVRPAHSRPTLRQERWDRRPAIRCTGLSSGASLVTLRGTDGLESGTGVMPLVYLTDFGGVMARSVPDLADMLNVVVAVDPDDPETSAPGRHTPADWRSVLDPDRAARQADRLHPVGVGRSVSGRRTRPTPRRRRCSSSWTPARRSSRWA